MSETTEQSLMSLSPEELAALSAKTKRIVGGKKFVPSAGRQEAAYFSKADILLYGGSGGAGKTALLLGLALNEHKKSLIMRREYVDLGGLTEEAIRFNGTRDGYNGSSPPKLRTADGRQIDFGACAKPGDEAQWQGRDHDLLCVGRGTLVLLSDNRYKPIEDIIVGDMVATLNGVRPVTRIFPAQHKESVEITAYDQGGAVIGSQVQSQDHCLLTNLGWVCHTPASELSHPPFSMSKGIHTFHRFVLSCARPFVHLFCNPSNFLLDLRRKVSRLLSPLLWARSCGSVTSASSAQGFQESDFSGFDVRRQGVPLRFLLNGPLAPLALFLRLFRFPPIFYHSSSSSGGIDERRKSLSEDSQENCSEDSHLYGERILLASGSYSELAADQLYLHQPIDAAPPIPNNLQVGESEETHGYTYHKPLYDHPYKKDKRQASESVCSCSYSVRRVGVKELYDIEVSELNHYITNGGFVNKNCFDEGAQWVESQFRFLLGWLRSSDPNQRCRVVIATNPPLTNEGEWLIRYFAPWLDPSHPNPAKAGELRWFVTTPDGEDMEVPDSSPVDLGGKRPSIPLSRSFIPATVEDNPFLRDTSYVASLDALPEPLRSAIRDGNFMMSRQDSLFQVIPSAWIRAAQARWKEKPPEGAKMTSMGVDPALGGSDTTNLAMNYNGWFAPITQVPGKDTPTGSETAALVVKYRRDNAPVVIDVGGGYGSSAILRLKDNGIDHIPFNGINSSKGRTKDGQVKFANRRASAWWKFREALDPDQRGGSPVALPPDNELFADLAAPRFDAEKAGLKIVQMESKSESRKLLKRSHGKGDSVVMAWDEGKHYHPGGEAPSRAQYVRSMPKVVMSYANRRRK